MVRLNNVGVARMNQQNLADALALFRQARQVEPGLVTPVLNEGIALLNMQQTEEARAVLLNVLEMNPNAIRAWYNLGLLYRNSGQNEEALEAFERAAEIDPADPDTHYFLGATYAQLSRFDEAVSEFERAISIFPFHVSARFGLARAYQQLDRLEDARQQLAEFQRLTQERLGTPISLVYGEQGQYSRAEEILRSPVSAPAGSEVRFVPASNTGLRFTHAGVPDSLQPEERVAAFLGSGACFFDYDADGLPDLLLLNSQDVSTLSLYRNSGDGRFEDVTATSGLSAGGVAIGCTVADFDNDGLPDLAVGLYQRVVLYRHQGNGQFQDVTDRAGIQTSGLPLGLTFVDYDHDGDTDLFVTRLLAADVTEPEQLFDEQLSPSFFGNVLWRNNGDGAFTDWTSETALEGSGPSVGAAITDFNNDRAVDFVVTDWHGGASIAVNPREGQFQTVRPWSSMPARGAGIAVFDFDKDGWMDVAFTHWQAPGVTLWRNDRGTNFTQVDLPVSGWLRGWGLTALDYDNDGWLDLAVAGESEDGAEVRLFRNLGSAMFEDVSDQTGLSALSLEHPRSLIAADYDLDGDVDLLLTRNGSAPLVLRNDGGNRRDWLRLTLKGLNDNKSAIGTKVEVYAGPERQKWEIQAGSGYLGQNSADLTVGLGNEVEADFVRMLWPTGVLQDEIRLGGRTAQAITEIDRRGSSCPVLFAWDGSRYRFITDAIGAGIMGHWVAPGQRNISDPTEYIKVEGSSVQPKDGRLSFRFMEPMEEVIYLDQVRLLAIDHPADIDVHPNEYFSASPPFPQFEVIASRDARPPVGAWLDDGRSVLPELQDRDRNFVQGFQSLPFKGFAELHGLQLDLGDWDAAHPLRLLMHGFIDYFSDTSIFAAYQAGVTPVPLLVEVMDEEGHWVRLPGDIGFPAGLVRTMIADLTGRIPAGTRRIRLLTNLKIYWDQILIDNTPGGLPSRVTEVPLDQAVLSFRGYPRQESGNPASDVQYVYEDVSATGPYAMHIGSYTNYGDVTDLLLEAEDRFVIFGTGEEIALEFDPRGLPAIAAGWTRDYFFFADGFTKDMDFYEAFSQTVEPLPFHGMGPYPHSGPGGYPDAIPYLDYLLNRNARHGSGNSRPAYFDFGSGTRPPDQK